MKFRGKGWNNVKSSVVCSGYNSVICPYCCIRGVFRLQQYGQIRWRQVSRCNVQLRPAHVGWPVLFLLAKDVIIWWFLRHWCVWQHRTSILHHAGVIDSTAVQKYHHDILLGCWLVLADSYGWKYHICILWCFQVWHAGWQTLKCNELTLIELELEA